MMENTRRSFLKKVSAAGIGAAGLAMAGNAGATTTAAEPQKKKTATCGHARSGCFFSVGMLRI